MLHLIDPPILPNEQSSEAALSPSGEWDPLERTRDIGSRTPRKLSRSDLINALIDSDKCVGDSTSAELQLVYTVTNLLYREHIHRLIGDRSWCRAYAAATSAVATAFVGEPKRSVLTCGKP